MARRLGRVSVARVTLPAGLVQLGRISDPTRFGEIVEQAKTSARPFRITASNVVIGLPEDQAFVKVVDFPNVLRRSELAKALEYQWQNLLPIAKDQVYYDSLTLQPAQRKRPVPNGIVLIVAYPRDVIAGIITVCANLRLLPRKLIPVSFGYAELFSQNDDEATLVLRSDTGMDLQAFIVRNKATHFSTTIHEAINDPLVTKRLDNIRTYYERNIMKSRDVITKAVIIPTAYSGYISRLVEPLSLTLLPVTAAAVHAPKGDGAQIASSLPLFGLLKSRFPISVLPDALVNEVKVKTQSAIVRTTLTYMTITLGLLLYFSLVFWTGLAFSDERQVQYAGGLVDRVRNEHGKLATDVATINQTLSRLVALRASTTNASSDLAAVYNTAQVVPGVTISRVVLSTTKERRLVISGTQTDPALQNTLIDRLKLQAPFVHYQASAQATSAPTQFVIELAPG